MRISEAPKAISIIKREIKRFKTPYVTEVSWMGEPFKVLVSCILSLRTKDDATRKASIALFKKADTPLKISRLRASTIERTIYPVGFYRNKARTIKDIGAVLFKHYDSTVPDSVDGLLRLKGVGRKTANLVVTMGYGKPGICVDTHVHRIVNRWGLVKTNSPEETEFALRRRLNKRYWITLNNLLVTYGQNVCAPVSPFCGTCRVSAYCGKIGVKRSR